MLEEAWLAVAKVVNNKPRTLHRDDVPRLGDFNCESLVNMSNPPVSSKS
jgi:hypothetical protein